MFKNLSPKVSGHQREECAGGGVADEVKDADLLCDDGHFAGLGWNGELVLVGKGSGRGPYPSDLGGALLAMLRRPRLGIPPRDAVFSGSICRDKHGGRSTCVDVMHHAVERFGRSGAWAQQQLKFLEQLFYLWRERGDCGGGPDSSERSGTCLGEGAARGRMQDPLF
jgi:hypothetical protein